MPINNQKKVCSIVWDAENKCSAACATIMDLSYLKLVFWFDT